MREFRVQAMPIFMPFEQGKEEKREVKAKKYELEKKIPPNLLLKLH